MDIKVSIRQDGKIVIRGPKGAMPDKHTVESLYQMICSQQIKEAVAWDGRKACLLLVW